MLQGLPDENPLTPEDQSQGEVLLIQEDELEEMSMPVRKVKVMSPPEKQRGYVARRNRRSLETKQVKQPDVDIELVLLQHDAAAAAERATNPKSSWKSRNANFYHTKQYRVRTTNRNPGRRFC
ncbi:hypothetical protein ACHWQZ_G010664 [Mnemiopsis leidyi]